MPDSFSMPVTPGRHIVRSVLWNHLGKVTEFAMLYLTTVLIARGLGVEANGRLAGILSFVQLLIVLSSAGIEVSLNRYLPREGAAGSGTRFVVNRLLCFRLGLYLIMSLVAAGALSVLNTGWTGFLALVFILGLLRCITPLLAMLLVARFRTGIAAGTGIVARSVELGALLVIGQGLSVPAVIMILIAGTAVQVIGYALASRVEWTGPMEQVAVRPVIAFGLVFWLNTIVDYFLGRQGDVMFLTYLRPETASASLYDVAYSLVQIGMMALTVGLGGVVLAAMSQYAATDQSRLRALYHVTVRLTSVLTIPFMGYLVVVAPELIALVYSGAYAGAADVLRILLCLRIVSRLFAAGENADFLLALGNVWTVVQIGIAAASATVAMHLLLIPPYGASGAAIASGTGTLLANALGGIAAVRLGHVRVQWQAWLRVTVAATIAGIAAFLIPGAAPSVGSLIQSGVVFFGLFAFLLFVVRPLHKEDLDVLRAAFGSVPAFIHHIALTDTEEDS
jgi:O-antigen/teichoic acid export membrane protein